MGEFSKGWDEGVRSFKVKRQIAEATAAETE